MLKRDIFAPRESIKPYEYPELIDYAKNLRKRYY